MHVWIRPSSLQLFCLAADTHSLALEGHRGTTETVGTVSGHIFDMDEPIARLTHNIMYGMDIVTKLLIFFSLKGLCVARQLSKLLQGSIIKVPFIFVKVSFGRLDASKIIRCVDFDRWFADVEEVECEISN